MIEYDDGARPQAEAGRLGLPFLERAAESVPLADGPQRFADLGCGGGGNSVEAVRLVIERWRRRTQAPIEVLHVDLPDNDFAAVLRKAKGYAAPNVFRACMGGSFYDPLFPPASLQLVWCATATHWLSRVPGPRPTGRSTYGDAMARQAWQEQARHDWERWLACRYVELVPGGQIVMVGSGADRYGRILAEGLLEMVSECLPGVSMPTYYRKLEEWTAPLGGSVRLLEHSEPEMPDPFWDAFQATWDEQAYADNVVRFVQASFGQALLERPPESVWDLLRQKVLANPERARCRWWVTVLRLEKATPGLPR